MTDNFQLFQIAYICHETNRAYCVTIGDISQPPWESAPEWQRKSAISGVKFHLDSLAIGHPAPPEASHNEWLKEKLADGWIYGHTKDPAAKTHPCILPYEELPLEQRIKDYLFAAIVKSFYEIGISPSKTASGAA